MSQPLRINIFFLNLIVWSNLAFSSVEEQSQKRVSFANPEITDPQKPAMQLSGVDVKNAILNRVVKIDGLEGFAKAVNYLLTSGPEFNNNNTIFFFDLDETIVTRPKGKLETFLTHTQWPDFLQKLQKTGYMTMALSAAAVNTKDGDKTSFLAERINTLKELGLSFNCPLRSWMRGCFPDDYRNSEEIFEFGNSFNYYSKSSLFYNPEVDYSDSENSSISFDPSIVLRAAPMLRAACCNNVIHTDFLLKSEALKEFFQVNLPTELKQPLPTNLVFVDDRVDFCKDVLRFCIKYGINGYIFYINMGTAESK